MDSVEKEIGRPKIVSARVILDFARTSRIEGRRMNETANELRKTFPFPEYVITYGDIARYCSSKK